MTAREIDIERLMRMAMAAQQQIEIDNQNDRAYVNVAGVEWVAAIKPAGGAR